MSQVSRTTDLDSLQREELEQQLITERLQFLENCEKKFIPFVKHVWPDFIDCKHASSTHKVGVRIVLVSCMDDR